MNEECSKCRAHERRIAELKDDLRVANELLDYYRQEIVKHTWGDNRSVVSVSLGGTQASDD